MPRRGQISDRDQACEEWQPSDPRPRGEFPAGNKGLCNASYKILTHRKNVVLTARTPDTFHPASSRGGSEMLRHFFAIAASLTLSACIVQAPPGYWERTAYPATYPPPYARTSNAPLSPIPAPPPPPTMPMSEQTAEYSPQSASITPASYSQPFEALSPQAGNDSPHEPRNSRATFADETIDYGVPPTNTLHLQDFDAPTPTHIEGARTITTLELRNMLDSDRPPLLIDVIGGEQTVSLPSAVWLRDAGAGRHLDDDVQAWFDFHLAHLTNRDKSHPLVIFCASRMCWMAHNAALRALDLGYKDVSWYRGGRDAWQAAGLPLAPVAPTPADE
jgi:PQQ-dependent catabolism-associated CXXCW motif protein